MSQKSGVFQYHSHFLKLQCQADTYTPQRTIDQKVLQDASHMNPFAQNRHHLRRAGRRQKTNNEGRTNGATALIPVNSHVSEHSPMITRMAITETSGLLNAQVRRVTRPGRFNLHNQLSTHRDSRCAAENEFMTIPLD